MATFHIPSDIRQASTLPAEFYRSAQVQEQAKERLFARSWQWVADREQLPAGAGAYPFTLLPGWLDEPLLLTRDEAGQLHCLSNVCTHRAKIIVEAAGPMRQLTCGYHGRCFDLQGHFRRMPAFKDVENFPSPADDLARISLEEWLGLYFVSLDPALDFKTMIAPMRERLAWLPLDTLTFSPAGSIDYSVQANWALYCDNYLEGFHVPFVHPGLNAALDFGQYDYECFPYCNLQIGIADGDEPCFDPPVGHPDHGRRVYAYYFWLFPNLMFNFYPWGLSLNVVEPRGLDRTLVRFRSYAFPGRESDRAVNRIDQTEMEDEAVVESVQQGLRSRFYQRGRFSPTMERCVHHFHALVAAWM